MPQMKGQTTPSNGVTTHLAIDAARAESPATAHAMALRDFIEQSVNETQSVRIEPPLPGSALNEFARRVVCQQQTPKFLLDQSRHLVAQHRTEVGTWRDPRCQAEHARLGVRAMAARCSRTAEEIGVGRFVSRAHAASVYRHQAPVLNA